MSDKLTGDISNFKAVQKEGVVLHRMPHVEVSLLGDIDHNVNDFKVSGKRLGAHVVGVVYDVDGVTVLQAAQFIAAGNERDSHWIVDVALAGTPLTNIVPA